MSLLMFLTWIVGREIGVADGRFIGDGRGTAADFDGGVEMRLLKPISTLEIGETFAFWAELR